MSGLGGGAGKKGTEERGEIERLNSETGAGGGGLDDMGLFSQWGLRQLQDRDSLPERVQCRPAGSVSVIY